MTQQLPEVRPPVTPPDAGTPTRVWLVATLTVAAIEMIRASGPLLDRAFATSALAAGVTAAGTYAAAGLVAMVLLVATAARSGIPAPRTVLTGAGALAVGRLVAQSLEGDALFWVGLVTVALAVAALTLAVAFVAGRPAGGRQAATGLLLGCGLSVGLQMTLGTWDALWRSGWSGWVLAVVIAVAPLLTARSLATGHGGAVVATGRPRRLWALGPFLALAAMIVANPAFVASQTGVALGIAGLVLVLASATGVWVLLRPQTVPGALRVAAAALVVLGAAGTMWYTGALALVAIVVLSVAVSVVLTGALTLHVPAARGVLRTGGATAVAGLGTVLPLVLYMLDYDVPLPVDNAWVVVVVALVLALTGLRRRTPATTAAAAATEDYAPTERIPARVNTVRLLLGPAVLLALVGLVPYGTSTTGPDMPARAGSDTLTVVTWNLHYGVSPSTAVDLEGIARTIASEHPDVVALQEVERGWILGGGTDMATWMSHRLGMTIRFAPAADRQFGNAVLSSSAVADTAIHQLPYGAGPQARSALSTTVVTRDGTPVRVTSVHLQHREENTPTRLDQLRALLAAEPVDGPSLLAGDLNAEPGSPEIGLLEDAGWVSAVDSAGDPAALTSPSDDPDARIDWVFGQRETFDDAVVPTEPRESDHLPVVTRATRAG
ncbi:endonuclease/exonuclease/phosphatase family protein [Cellulomonas edaphi]|uniref:Endonuclease/exonuclease/phosphatase family protein n=1 Tax=Cellulomonas edaphi TaxID=3053468 RepID=A0ABT7S5F7_9CELL|nr:endonuclease/exonuclease/phosphatase family protein [Cellulomons edaphi]MDM7830846.1 endonuclease/exonuclease/phosphatase family protein [Cellulomons edaphi]